MGDIKLKLTLLAGLAAATLPMTSGAAPRVVFASGGGVQAGTVVTGALTFGGSTQIQTDDGALVAFVGPARIGIDRDGLLMLLEGHATIAGAGVVTRVRTPSGVVTVERGAAVLQVSGGRASGRTLAGLMVVEAGGARRRFRSGMSFAGRADGQIVAAVSAGAQPVSDARAPEPGQLIDQPFTVSEVMQNASIFASGLSIGRLPGTENVALPVYPSTGRLADLLQQALAARAAAGGFEFSQISQSALAAQLAFLRAGGVGGQLDADFAATALKAYLDYLKAGGLGGDYASSLALLRAYFDYLSSVGLPSNLDPAVRKALLDYIAFIEAGGVFGAPDGPTSTPPSNPNPPGDPTTPTGPTTPVPPAAGQGVGAGTTLALSTDVSGLYSGGPADPGLPKIALDAAGKPQALGYYGQPATATLADFQSGPGYILGRFGGGTFGSLSFAANDGAHFAILTPTTDLPTSGSATYSVAAFTTPTVPGGGADFTRAKFEMTLGVGFGSHPTFGFEGALTGAEGGGAVTLKFASPGGSAAPSLTNSNIDNGALSLFGGTTPLSSASGPICGAGCKFAFNAISGGKGASGFAVGYGVIDGTSNKSILNGAAVLIRN